MSEQRYYIPDIESGIPLEVPKETWERYMRMRVAFMPKIDDKRSVPILFGTSGNMEQGDNNFDLFFNKSE